MEEHEVMSKNQKMNACIKIMHVQCESNALLFVCLCAHFMWNPKASCTGSGLLVARGTNLAATRD